MELVFGYCFFGLWVNWFFKIEVVVVFGGFICSVECFVVVVCGVFVCCDVVIRFCVCLFLLIVIFGYVFIFVWVIINLGLCRVSFRCG